MANVNLCECVEAEILPKDILRLARRMERIGRDARKLGLTILCGSVNWIGVHQPGNDRALILANFSGPFDGG